MNEQQQAEYAATRAKVLEMLDDIATFAADFKNPEDATWADVADLNRLKVEVSSIYERVYEKGEFAYPAVSA